MRPTHFELGCLVDSFDFSGAKASDDGIPAPLPAPGPGNDAQQPVAVGCFASAPKDYHLPEFRNSDVKVTQR